VPNSPLPVVLIRSALTPNVSAKGRRFREAFRRRGWTGIWADTVYDYTHFHSNAHEVLGIAKGKVTVFWEAPKADDSGSRLAICSGFLPAWDIAGFGEATGLKVIGAYPPGQSHFTMKRKGRAVPRVRLPDTDPFYGPAGPLTRCWTK